MLTYLLQSSFILLLFYLVFILFFRPHTQFKFNRAYLITTLFISIIVPLLEFETSNETVTTASTIISNSLSPTPAGVSASISIKDALLAIYALGVIISLLVLLYKVIKLMWSIRNGDKMTAGNYQLVEVDQDMGVCSFLKYIIVPKKYTPNTFEITHERSHIEQYHSIDILIAWLYQSIFWFNPVAYLYLFRMVEVHEFLADQSAIQKLGKPDYQNHILQVLSQKLQPKLSHNFNSIIKTRLTMMNSNTRPNGWSYFSAVVVLCTTLFLFSCHAKKAAFFTMTPNGPIEVMTETVVDTVMIIDYDTYEEKISYIKKELYYVADTTIVIDLETYEESISIVKTYLEPQDLIKK